MAQHISHPFGLKRIFWIVGMAALGFALGYHGSGISLDLEGILIGTIWGGCIGFGFGGIFDPSRPHKMLLVYWSVTFALVAAFFAPFVPLRWFLGQVLTSGALGATLGFCVGYLQLRSSQTGHR